jgi:KUP system potassium uptake protein
MPTTRTKTKRTTTHPDLKREEPEVVPHEAPKGLRLAGLSLAALGVVFGDIGTSPLYSLKVCFDKAHGLPVTDSNILGILSLMFWVLVFTITIKYLGFVLRADNRGEGGILALMSLTLTERVGGGNRWLLITLGLFGAALLYGDGIITPAITVLGAVEGLEVATPAFSGVIIPVTVVLLVGLFMLQSRGTGGVGAIFGPVMIAWFFAIGAFGLWEILRDPAILAALNPAHCARFFLENRWVGFLALGGVFLVVTGGEALYADMGHFGARPIRLVWFSLVLPSLLLNYFGQGALLLRNPAAAEDPFFHLPPQWAVLPMVVLAAAAAIIASQAVISGSFSLTRQAIQLGYCPRLLIKHTSSREIGQIYLPAVNGALMVSTILLVLSFKSSDNLAAAYGVAVTTTMVITSILFFFVARDRWGWNPWLAGTLCAAFLAVDAAFFGANVIKIGHGGWLPLALGVLVYTLLATWKKGRGILASRLQETSLPTNLFIADVERHPPLRVPGTAVYMTGAPSGVPPAMLHNLKHNHVLHERVIFLTTVTEEVPHVPRARRLLVEELGKNMYRFVARYGFMETPNVPKLLERARRHGFDLDIMQTTFFLGRETLIPSKRPGMAIWREWLFAFMSRNAQSATSYFGIPVNRVVELGTQIQI